MCSKCELQKTTDVAYLQEPKLEEYFDEFVGLMKNYFDDQTDNYLNQIEALALKKTLDEQMLLDYIAEIEKLLEKIAQVGQLKVTGQVQDELQSLAALDFEVSLTIDDEIAKNYALQRGGELIKGINATTQTQMGELINKALDEGWSKGYLAEQINTKFKQYNDIRSALIAHQEIALAYGNSKRLQFTQHAGEFQQIGWKRAQTQNDSKVRPEHFQNQEDGYIEADKTFSGTGDMNEPFGFNCYDKHTRVLTKRGLIPIQEVKEGDYCLTICPNTQELSWQRVIATAKKKQGEIIHFHNNIFSMAVSKDHRMLYRTERNRKTSKVKKYRFIEASKLPKWGTIPRSGNWIGKQPEYKEIGSLKIKFEDYCEFMGRYLSEGSVTKRSDNCYQIQIAQEKYPDKVEDSVRKLGIDYYVAKDYVGFNNLDLGKYLMQFGKSYEKHIPEDIKESTVENIQKFLSSFALGDGSISKPREKTFMGNKYTSKPIRFFFTSSKVLADDIVECLAKIGSRASLVCDETKGSKVKFRNGEYTINHNIYRITECKSKYTNICNLKRHIVKYDDYVYGLEVEKNKTLYVERDGKFAFSGNCRCVVAYRLFKPDDPAPFVGFTSLYQLNV